MQIDSIFNTIETTKTILVKLEKYKKSGDPWTLGPWSKELKRYMLLHQKQVIDLLIDTKNQIHPNKKYILVMTGRNNEHLSNNELEHLLLIKGTIVDVTTVIKPTGVMNAEDLLI